MQGRNNLYTLCDTTMVECTDEHVHSPVVGFQIGDIVAMRTTLPDLEGAVEWIRRRLDHKNVTLTVIQKTGHFVGQQIIVVGSVRVLVASSDQGQIVTHLRSCLRTEEVHIFQGQA